jgi:CHAT domain-containing protein
VLVKPVTDSLAPRVFVVPDGPLNLLPFSALWTGKGWTVERWTFASLPSANHLRMLKAVGTPSARAALAFNCAGMGPESEPKAGTKRCFKRLETWRGFRATWPHLPFTEKETQAFNETFPQATVYAGPAASRQNFLDRAGTADVLEIATHAVFVPDNPMLSWVAAPPRAPSLPRPFPTASSSRHCRATGRCVTYTRRRPRRRARPR